MDQIYKYGIWAGSRLKLIDEMNLGRYCVKIYDSASSQLIYSKGFDSYFGEYKTSTEGIEGIKKTFHESAIIPYPKNKIVFALDRRDEKQKLFEFFRREIDPLSRSPDHTRYFKSRVASLPASIIARAFGLGGGSYTLDAACASSLYSVKLACAELHAGRADAMLAGGVARPDCLFTQVGFSQLRALSPSGRCAPFDRDADGLVVGEGAGILVLKRLPDALRDGARIWGLIRGMGLSNDLRGNLVAPEVKGQLRAMQAAYSSAGWAPSDVDLIECHVAGTPVGDAAELESLRRLWGESQETRASGGMVRVRSVA